MPNAWGGADPVATTDPGSYELANEYVANQDVTLTGVRLWGGPSDTSVANRKARIWSSAGALLGTATLPNVLTAGWATYALAASITRPAGSRFIVSYTTAGMYGALTGGLDGSVNSADSAVTCLSAATSTLGNGCFSHTQTAFPDTASGNHAFYGSDVVYSLGIAGPTPPVIDNLTVTVTDATATAAVTAHSAQSLMGATYRYQWGDGTTTSSGLATAAHTYAASGDYAVLVSVTDANGLSAYAAQAVDAILPQVGGLDFQALVDQLTSHAAALGVFESVNGHEPLSAVGSGVVAAVWFNTMRPASSGLASTTVVVVCTVRCYKELLTQSPDTIDPDLVSAASKMIGSLTGDLRLGGIAREVDLMGRFGTSLAAQSAYQTITDVQYRVITITVPIVVNDAWDQA